MDNLSLLRYWTMFRGMLSVLSEAALKFAMAYVPGSQAPSMGAQYLPRRRIRPARSLQLQIITALHVLLIGFAMLPAISLAQPVKKDTGSIIRKDKCRIANAHLSSGAVSLAEKEYNKVLEALPLEDCALSGLRNIADIRCQVALTRAHNGDLEGAKDMYLQLLKSDADLNCAIEGLATVRNLEIKGLIEIGSYEAAWKKLGTARAANPDDKEIRSLSEGLPFQLRGRYQVLIEAGKWLTDLLIFLSIVVLLCFTIQLLWSRQRLKLDIGDFVLGSAALEKDAAKAGCDPNKAVATRFEESLSSWRLIRKLDSVKPVAGPVEVPALPDVSFVPKEAKALWGLITKVIPDKVVTIKGSLEFDKAKGAGLHVRLISSRGNEVWQSHTIWQRDVAPFYGSIAQPVELDDYLWLAELAAIWAYWMIHKHTHPKDSIRRYFGTDNVDSYISTQVAAKIHGKNPKLAMERLYKALTDDNENFVARYNLARTRSAQHIDDEEDLKKVKAMTEDFRQNRVHILATYALGVLKLHRYCSSKCQDSLKEAKKLLAEAVSDAEKANEKDALLISDELMQVLRIVYFDAVILSGDRNALGQIDEIERANYASPRILYALACHKSTLVKYNIVPEQDEDKELEKALKYLGDVLLASRSYADIVYKDPSLDVLLSRKQKEIDAMVSDAKKPSTAVAPAKSFSLGDLVGVEHGKCLQTAGIQSFADLYSRASTVEGREKLSKKCLINGDLLLLWAETAELLRIAGIDAGIIVLLYSASISSLDRLKSYRSKEGELLCRLREAVQSGAINVKLPVEEELKWWVEQARHTQSLIEQ